MTHASIPSKRRASYDANAALTMYRFELEQALEPMKIPEIVSLGTVETTNMLTDTWEIDIDSPEFKELVGGPRFREDGQLFFEIAKAVYQDGVQKKAKVLESEEWARRAWGRKPATHALAVKSLFERIRATGMMNSKTDVAVDNKKGQTSLKTAATSRPCNPLKPVAGQTYDSLKTSCPLSVDGIKTARDAFTQQKAINGVDYSGTTITHIECGPDLWDTALSLTKDDRIVVTSGSSTAQIEIANPLKRYAPITAVMNPYLTEAGVWYAWAADEFGRLPTLLIIQLSPDSGAVPGMPSGEPTMGDGLKWEIIDKDSDSYKLGSSAMAKGWVGISAEIELGFKIINPRRFIRCEA